MMDSDILTIFQQYAGLGLIAACLGCVVIFLYYHLVYRKLLKKTKTLSAGRLLLWAAFLFYLCIVAGAVFMSRGAHPSVDGWGPPTALFSAYRTAWINASPIEWRNIILNILLFVPLGVFMPLLCPRLRRLWKTVIIGLILTVCIEFVQRFTGWGTFEWDDMLNNTAGALIGYGLYRFAAAIREGRPVLRRVVWLSPFVVTVMVFSGLAIAYDAREFGLLPETWITRQDMSGLTVRCDAALSDEPGEAAVYETAGVASRTQAQVFAEAFFEKRGLTIDPGRFDDYPSYAGYWARDGQQSTHGYNLSVQYRGMTWDYTDFSSFEDIQTNGQANQEIILKKLSEFGVIPPVGAVFADEGDGVYSFTATPRDNGGPTFWGSLTCTYYADDTIKEIDGSLLACQPKRKAVLISEQDAYGMLEDGYFSGYLFAAEVPDGASVDVLSVALAYRMDSKGFLQPVYVFQTRVSEWEPEIVIPALA